MIIQTPTATRFLHKFRPDNMLMSNPPNECCMCRCVCARAANVPRWSVCNSKLNWTTFFRFHKIDLLKFSSCLTYKFSFQRYVGYIPYNIRHSIVTNAKRNHFSLSRHSIHSSQFPLCVYVSTGNCCSILNIDLHSPRWRDPIFQLHVCKVRPIRYAVSKWVSEWVRASEAIHLRIDNSLINDWHTR